MKDCENSLLVEIGKVVITRKKLNIPGDPKKSIRVLLSISQQLFVK